MSMIVLISGWAGFRTSLIPLEHELGRRLRRQVVRADLGLGFGCIRESAERAAAVIDQLAVSRHCNAIDVVGHSMGGLVATYLLKRLDRGRLIRSVITLGAPHRGSPAVLLARGLLERVSSSISQMAPDSEFLQALAAAAVPATSRLVSIAAHDDRVVPARYAELPRRARQFTRHVAGVSHLGLLFSSDVVDEIEPWLTEPAPVALAS